MRKTLLLITCLLVCMLASAQAVKTGMTPYIFHHAWEKVQSGNVKGGEALLKRAGYSKVGEYHPEIGFNIIYAKGCTVSVSDSGQVKSAKAKDKSGYASYMQIGAGTGFCYDMSITFLNEKGVQAFVEMLKSSGYKMSRKDLYDWGKIENVWERASDRWFILQDGNTFYIDEGPCA